MRTITFRSVFEGTLRRMGIDPQGEALRYDTARALTEHINNALEYAWILQDWPELMATEERAFRQTWRAGNQYRRSNSAGVPDEIFYLPNSTYYGVNPAAVADPPVGTLPTNAAYFQALNPLDPYVAFDQVGRQSIGEAYGVYNANPRTSRATGLRFRSSERGLDVQAGAGATVFVFYRLRPSRFTMVPYADGRAYKFHDLIYDPDSGECYVAVSDNTGLPPNTPTYWRKVPFPEFLRAYVVAAAAANALREWEPSWQASPTYGTASVMQGKLAFADKLEAEAERYLERQCDMLVEQGHHAYYTLGHRSRRPYWITTPVFDGTSGGVSTLADIFVDEWGGPAAGPADVTDQAQGLLLPLVNGQEYLDFTFTTPKSTDQWELENAVIENTTDLNPLLLFWNLVSRTVNGGRILLNGAPDSNNYKFRARVRVTVPT